MPRRRTVLVIDIVDSASALPRQRLTQALVGIVLRQSLAGTDPSAMAIALRPGASWPRQPEREPEREPDSEPERERGAHPRPHLTLMAHRKSHTRRRRQPPAAGPFAAPSIDVDHDIDT